MSLDFSKIAGALNTFSESPSAKQRNKSNINLALLTEDLQEQKRKDRLRKDRYSSLIMANWSARRILRTSPPPIYDTIGGFARGNKGNTTGPSYVGPSWFTEGMKDVY